MSDTNATPRGRPLEAAGKTAAIAQQSLRTSGYATALHNVRCESEAGAVVLRGCVSSYYVKQLAQEVVRNAQGARVIINELEVEDRPPSAANDPTRNSNDVRPTETQGSTEAMHGYSDTDRG